MKSGIYKIVNIINNKLYVGSSIDYRKRKIRHLKDLNAGTHHCIYLQRAVIKYGIENFKFFLLERCPIDNLLKREQYYIDTLCPEYNTYKTAGSPLGFIRSDEAKEKARLYAIENNIKPPESTWKDKQLKVYQLHKDTLEPLDEFDSLSEACRSVGKDATFATTISSCCKNERYSAFGYRWVFNLCDISSLRVQKSRGGNIAKNPIVRESIPVIQTDYKGNFIKEWTSVKEAESVFGKGIGNCARGVSNSSNGFKWKYKK